MFDSISYKSKQFFVLSIKLFIVIGCAYFIYDKVFKNQEQSFSVFYSFLAENKVFSLKNSYFLPFFTIFNWFFEILKWQYLVTFLKKISFYEALKQSLGSLTASLITPNRIGEYGAKALYFEKVERKKIVLLNLIGNLSQLITTVFFGLIGLLFLALKFKLNLHYNKIILVFVITFLSIIILRFITKKGFTIYGYSLQSLKYFLSSFKKKTLKKVMLFSIFRFLIFSHQFYFLFIILNVNISYTEAMSGIFATYLIASIIPMLSLFDVVIKSSVAIFVFSFLVIDKSTVLTIVLLMWIFNFAIPSILGSYFVLTFNAKLSKSTT